MSIDTKTEDTGLAYMPPQEIEAEQMVLGACLIDPRGTLSISHLQPDDFYKTAHRLIYSTMRMLYDNGTDIDILTVAGPLKNAKELQTLGGAVAYLSSLIAMTPTTANFAAHERLVISAAQRRAIIKACSEAQTLAYTTTDADAIISSCISSLNKIRRHDNSMMLTYSDLIHQGFAEIEKRYELHRAGRLAGIPTGFRTLDDKLHGFQPQLYVIAGAAGMGKTALAEQFVRTAAQHFQSEWDSALPDTRPLKPHAVGVISLEMGPQQLAIRALSSMSNVPLSRLLAGSLGDTDWDCLTQTAGKTFKLPIVCEFTAFTDRALERTIDDMVQRLGARMILFDYLQLARCENYDGTREQEVTAISRLCKRKVQQHQIPIIVISSLNKNLSNRQDKRPVNSDLRESGNIEFDADVIMFVYRDEVYNCKCPRSLPCGCGKRGKAEIIISKGRMEGTGIVELEWHTNTTTFREPSETQLT